MSREVRRVSLDFDWPLSRVWSGYRNPHARLREDCGSCGGNGGSPAYRLLQALWYRHSHGEAWDLLRTHTFPVPLYSFALRVLEDAPQHRGGNGTHGGWGYHLDQRDVDALVAADRLWDFTRRPLSADQAIYPNGWTVEPNGHHPTAEEVNAWARRGRGAGHDGQNNYVCVVARCRRYRVAQSCVDCRGRGYIADRSLSARIARWRPTEPPVGEGYQLWETVSEGSPISPVFARPEDLAAWLVANDRSVTRGRPYETWLRFIRAEGATGLTMAQIDGELLDGVEAWDRVRQADSDA